MIEEINGVANQLAVHPRNSVLLAQVMKMKARD